ncbi:GntR family transcriptional regulator [Streptomyces bauhiniae]|uniref:GntR family transcriptional regulator n=1 Tax=Streptomyces bauhiniae TaxID=2340725 RepID=A0A7K3QWQ7_9ACTN|nr:GntR family transcriptional regulator [Streptomyces bauhiniae]NEB94320.1 GntR family transcriptional regulator [Streptomyces bauhiniae]
MQIVQQTKQAMRLGILVQGSQLPTAREVVATAAINPNTVHKAYRELEHEGLVESRRGAGTFVIRSLSRPAANADSSLREGLREWLHSALAAGLDREDARALFEAALEDVAPLTTGEGGHGQRAESTSPEKQDAQAPQHSSTEVRK